MIKCPNCGNTIPASNQICQFCKNPIPVNLRAAVPKPNYKHDDDSLEAGSGLPPDKVWKIYTGLAWFWIITAGLGIMLAILSFLPKPETAGSYMIGIIFDLITLLIGAGLLAKNEVARKAATFFCILSILRGLLLVLGGMISLLYAGIFGIPFLIVYIFNLCLAAGMIWAVNETERLMNWERMNYRR